MAALLRTARLLKYKPPCLLQITGNKSAGVQLARPYSGATTARKLGVGPRQLFPTLENARRHLLPYTSMFGRNFAVATKKSDESGAAVRSKQAKQFDWALSKLDTSVRKIGCIPKVMLLRVFSDICKQGHHSGNQVLLLLRSCGSLIPEVSPEHRTELAHRIWERLKDKGVQYDVSHYNALLKVYLQNEFKFCPIEFIAKMEAANTLPNRVTYQRLIASYCQNGDVDGASTILGFMKDKDLPITELVFNSLITGHACAGDIESAKNILTVMKNAGIEPSPDTYVSLLNAYAQNGDMENVKATLEAAESADCSLFDKDIMQVIFTLAKAGYHQHVPELMERMRHEMGYIPDAMNLCLSLLTHGHEDTAFKVLKSFPFVQMDNVIHNSETLANLFLKHCVTMETSLEKIGQYCKELQENNFHTSPLFHVLSCALKAQKLNMSLEIMKMMKDQKMPVRPHFFWPLLTAQVKKGSTDAVLEVLKAMDSLGVTVDMETFSNYVVPAFPSTKEARQSLKEANISLESSSIMPLELSALASQDLASFYTLLSDESSPKSNFKPLRLSLIAGFRRSSDVASMVKITELLFNNEDFWKNEKPAEATAFLLYSLIDSMPAEELQEQENKLRLYFNQLHEKNITITTNIFRGIRNLLNARHVPELINDVFALVPAMERTSQPVYDENNLLDLEKKLEQRKSRNDPISVTLKHIVLILAEQKNLQRALELKQKNEEHMTAATYAILINLCCRIDNAEEALNLKREMRRKDPSELLSVNNCLALISTLVKNGKVEEAIDILKEMKEKGVVLGDQQHTVLFHIINSASDADTMRRLLDYIFTLTKPASKLCSPLINVHLKSNDLPGALDTLLECHRRYNCFPRIHDVVVGLVELGDTELLQKAIDYLSENYGEMLLMYELFFAFLQTGRFREARKVIETPGFRAKPGRLQWYAERCISLNQMEILEQMVEMTSNLFECDRDEMYRYILRLCKNTNDWRKAEVIWTKMQEENVIPRETTLHLLADILKDNNQEVPFEVPEAWYANATAPNYNVKLLSLCNKGNVKEAYELLKDIEKMGVSLDPSSYDKLISSLCAEGAVKDAMDVKDIATSHIPSYKLNGQTTNKLIYSHCRNGNVEDALTTFKSMLQLDQMPSARTAINLVQALGSQGHVAGIDEVETLITEHCGSLILHDVIFSNNKVLAHIKNGDLDAAVEIMESVYTNPDHFSSSPMTYVFRTVLEDGNDEAFDRLNATAERLANHFACYSAAADIFLQLLDMGKVEDAKFMLARCNAVAEQKKMMTMYLAKVARKRGQVDKIKTLMHLIPDFTEKEVLYNYLMKCHELDKDLESAKALLEQMQKEGVEVYELSLKRLASLYHKAGETVPFPEPPESFKFYQNKLKEKSQEKFSETQITEV